MLGRWCLCVDLSLDLDLGLSLGGGSCGGGGLPLGKLPGRLPEHGPALVVEEEAAGGEVVGIGHCRPVHEIVVGRRGGGVEKMARIGGIGGGAGGRVARGGGGNEVDVGKVGNVVQVGRTVLPTLLGLVRVIDGGISHGRDEAVVRCCTGCGCCDDGPGRLPGRLFVRLDGRAQHRLGGLTAAVVARHGLGPGD